MRRVFSAGGSPAYAYDPYGNPLQGTTPLTDMGYAGMFQNPDSGLSLTQYRAYDPAAGRWLARDPLGERNAEGTNLYAYVSGNPISYIDPLGLCSDDDRDKEAEKDYAKCRSLSDPAARAACWSSAADRDAARSRGKPLPPLRTNLNMPPESQASSVDPWRTAAWAAAGVAITVGIVLAPEITLPALTVGALLNR